MGGVPRDQPKSNELGLQRAGAEEFECDAILGHREARCRNVFPLPRRRGGDAFQPSCWRQPALRDSLEHLVDDAVVALNSLDGARAGRPLVEVGRTPDPQEATPLQRSLLDRLETCGRSLGPAPPDLHDRRALVDVMGCRDFYRIDDVTTRVPLNLDYLKICSERLPLKQVADVVGEEARPFALDPEKYIEKSEQEAALVSEHGIVPYVDPQLANDPAKFKELIGKLDAAGLIAYTVEAFSFVGVFAVLKKAGPWQRLVIDARVPNLLHRRAPYAPLAAPSALANVDLSHLRDDGVESDVCGCGADLTDGFYQFVFDAVAPWFCFDVRGTAGSFGTKRVLRRDRRGYEEVAEDTVVFPCFRGLPMGWSWALFFCHSALTDLMLEASTRAGFATCRVDAALQLVRDKMPAPKLLPGRPLLLPYVDNANVLTWDAAESRRYHRCLLEVLAERKFVVKDLVVAERSFELVGVIFDAATLCFRAKPARVWRMRAALREVLARRRLTGGMMRKLVGHLVNHFLLARSSLAILQNVYRFSVDNIGKMAALPFDVLAELRVALGVLPLVFHDAGRRLSRDAFCSDASGRGFALHVATFGRGELEEVCALRERWRFREAFDDDTPALENDLVDDPSRRQRGCEAVLVSMAPRSEEWLARQSTPVLGRTYRMPLPPRQPTALVEVPGIWTKVPDNILIEGRWRRVIAGAWRTEAPIHLKEAFASLLGLKRACRTKEALDTRILSLGDKLPEVLSQEKGRATDHGLNAVCRRSASYRLGFGVVWHRRYVETARNPSDRDSRLAYLQNLKPGEIVKTTATQRKRAKTFNPNLASRFALCLGGSSNILASVAFALNLRVCIPVVGSGASFTSLSHPKVLGTILGWIRGGIIGSIFVDLTPRDEVARGLVHRVLRAASAESLNVGVFVIERGSERKVTTRGPPSWERFVPYETSFKACCGGGTLRNLLTFRSNLALPSNMVPPRPKECCHRSERCPQEATSCIAPSVAATVISLAVACCSSISIRSDTEKVLLPRWERSLRRASGDHVSPSFAPCALARWCVVGWAPFTSTTVGEELCVDGGVVKRVEAKGVEAASSRQKSDVQAADDDRPGPRYIPSHARGRAEDADHVREDRRGFREVREHPAHASNSAPSHRPVAGEIHHGDVLRRSRDCVSQVRLGGGGLGLCGASRGRESPACKAGIERVRPLGSRQVEGALAVGSSFAYEPVVGQERIDPCSHGPLDRLRPVPSSFGASRVEERSCVPPAGGVRQKWAVVICPSTEDATTKTGTQDDTLEVGTPGSNRGWLCSLLRAATKRANNDDALLFPLTLAEFEKVFATAVKALDLQHLKVTPHCLRHGGASTDVYFQWLDLLAVQQRGRWVASSSVLRYSKHGRLLRQLRSLDGERLRTATLAETWLKSTLPSLLTSGHEKKMRNR